MYAKYFKRLIDFVLGLLGIILLSPLFAVLIVMGLVFMRGNPFFTQRRPGKNGQIFNLIKFRTMDERKDKNGNLLPDDVRLNRYGRVLRSTSLDELPELFNIIRGEMSIVGPRPLLPEYLPYYTDKEMHRHDVRPGLTGLAQVKGRSFLTWEEIFAFDLDYVHNCTLKMDISILIMTVKKVLKREDIADVSKAWKDENGRYHCFVDGKDTLLHDPLNIERERNNA